MEKLPTALKDCQNIGLVGLGNSNLGVLSHLEKCESAPSICVRAQKGAACGIYPTHIGENYLSDITEDALILSPSVRPDLAPILEARARGTRILSDAEIFFRDTKAQCYAVSGSDGKSTTTAILSHLLTAAMGKSVPAVGNIGCALTPLLAKKHRSYAVELSSFQLFHFAPKTKRAVITNLTENHLNWHKDIEEYRGSKARLYEKTEEPIVSPDDIGSKALLKKPAFTVYSPEKSESEMKKYKAEFTYYIKNDSVYENGHRLFPLSLYKLCGKHNLYNLLAAVAMTAGHICAESARAIANFSPLSHRCEPIGEFFGVRFFDSSIDTTPARTEKTLSSFPYSTVLLLGGLGKGCSLLPLLRAAKERCRAVIGFGPFGQEALAFLSEAGFHGYLSAPQKTLADAVLLAQKIAKRGEAVLLSPAATSYDEFENYEARGEAFRRLVQNKAI